MTVRYGLAGAALDSGTAPVVDGCGCPWLRYRGDVAIRLARSLRVWAAGLRCGRPGGTTMTAVQLDPAFIAILSCLHCGAEVAQVEERLVCRNPQCGRRYPIEDGIPVMLSAAAEAPTSAPSGQERP